MKLFVLNKGGAQIAALQLQDPPSLPRVGDELALPAVAPDNEGLMDYLVNRVVWVLNKNRLEVEITCQPFSVPSQRLDLLQSMGWAPASPAEEADEAEAS